MSVTPASFSCCADTAMTEIGTSWTFWLRFCAVTMTSSSVAGPPVSAALTQLIAHRSRNGEIHRVIPPASLCTDSVARGIFTAQQVQCQRARRAAPRRGLPPQKSRDEYYGKGRIVLHRRRQRTHSRRHLSGMCRECHSPVARIEIDGLMLCG
jgi:hypothetical protein